MHFERIADKKRLQFIVSKIENSAPQGSPVLDMGCGNGIIAKAVAEAGYKVDAVDVSEKTIDAAKHLNRHPDIYYFVLPSSGQLPSAKKYSAIICSEVIEHLHDPGYLLSQLHSLLEPRGVLIVTVPNGTGPREIFVTRPVQWLQTKNNPASRLFFAFKKALGYHGTTVQSSADDLSHVQFFTVKSLRKLAAANGFTIVSFHKSNFIEQVFPFSLLTRRSAKLQQADWFLASVLPLRLTSGFMTVWKKAP